MKGGTFLTGLGLGLGAMYFFDQDRGRTRRAELRDTTTRALRVSRDASSKTWRDLRNRTEGVTAAVTGRLHGRADTAAVIDRVRSQIGRWVSNPRTLVVDADEGRVTLSGPVLASEMDALIAAVAKVRGVTEVVNRLEAKLLADDVPGFKKRRPTGSAFDVTQESWAPATRLLVGGGGGALLSLAVAKRNPLSPLLGLVALGLLSRSVTNRRMTDLLGRSRRGMIRVQKTINISAPVEDTFRFWSDFSNLPRFMSHLTQVESLGGNRSHWKAQGPGGVEVKWDAEVTQLEPNRVIGWRSVEGSEVASEGAVHFEPHDGGTRIHVEMRYTPPGGALGHAVAKLFGDDPKSAMDEDLLRLKSMLEAGRTTTEGAELRREELQ